jgi:hypothetical protein
VQAACLTRHGKIDTRVEIRIHVLTHQEATHFSNILIGIILLDTQSYVNNGKSIDRHTRQQSLKQTLVTTTRMGPLGLGFLLISFTSQGSTFINLVPYREAPYCPLPAAMVGGPVVSLETVGVLPNVAAIVGL